MRGTTRALAIRSSRPRGALRDVYVARTVQEGQKPLERFLARTARHLGPAAIVNALGSTHLTFLESWGVRSHFRTMGYTPDDIRAFRGDLEGCLREKVPVAGTEVRVDPERPLRWMAGRKLALTILPDEHLWDVREAAESFLGERFGELPVLRDFRPHITIGKVLRQVSHEERSDPMQVLPEDLCIPQNIALNGLAVFLGRIT